MSISRVQGLALLLWTGLVVSANGSTIINASGPNDDSSSQSSLSNTLAIGFSLASDYSNVSISAALESFFGDGTFTLSAFLTKQIGTGTNALTDEVASFSNVITIPNSPTSAPFTITDFIAFSGLSLTAGNYYLTLSGAPSGSDVFWVTSPNDGTLTTTTFDGASVIAPALSGGSLDPYLPASTFNDDSSLTGLWFQVTGDIDTGVPEPSSLLLVAPGLVLAWMKRRSFSSQKA